MLEILQNCCASGATHKNLQNNGDEQGNSTIINNIKLDKKAVLYQNTPNPFSSKTEIKYYLPENTTASAILIFDMQGTLLKTYKLMNTGNGSFEIFGGEFRPGMYLYSLIVDGKEIDTKKMILTE